MKLRNKKTGKIGFFCYGYTNELCVYWQKDDGFWGKQEYNSLAKLNEEWEDYKEPKKRHYYIEPRGQVIELDFGDDIDELKEELSEIGNYFETKEEAEKAVEKLKAWQRLKDKGFRFTSYDLYSGSSVKDKTEGEFAISAECSDFVDNKDLDILFGGEEQMAKEKEVKNE